MGRSRKAKGRNYSSAKRRAETHKGGWEQTTLNVGTDIKFFTLDREGIRKIDILPYQTKASTSYVESGELHYERTFWIHRSVGANNDAYVCLAKTMNKPCPICEHRRGLMKDPDADENVIKEMAPKERQLWNVIDRDEPDKGVQLWDISYHLFGKLLDKEIRNSDEDDEFDTFFHLEDGKVLKLGIGERSFAGRSFYEVETIGFKNRPEPYDDDVLEKVHCLDDCLLVLEYDKLKAIFLQTESVGGDEEKPAPPSEEKKPRREKSEKKEVKSERREYSAGDTVFYQGGPCEVLKVSGDGTSLMLEDLDGEIHRAIGHDDLDDEKVEKAKPPKKSKSSKPKESVEDEVESSQPETTEAVADDDDWDDWE